MDKMAAVLLLENLLDRVELDSNTGKWRLGTLSSKERLAIEFALALLGGGAEAPPPVATPPAPTPVVELPVPPDTPSVEDHPVAEIPQGPTVVLDIRSLERTSADNLGVTLCLDFGTAMSKAFAMQGDEEPIEIALGVRAGGGGYPVDSALFITDDGLIFFGPQAVARGSLAAESGRARFDSPKARLSMGEQGEIDKIYVGADINPTSTPLSEGELITLYLGYLTNLAVSELESHGHSRYTRRRFARPCWSDDRNRWAEPLLRRMLAQAQILADTFDGRWQAGISVGEAKVALAKLRELATFPDYLLDQGIPEPVAAAASLMLRDEAQREIFMVIDVGAGTTDFGVFWLQNNPDKEICLTRIIPDTIEYLPEAGNRVDDLLKFYVLDLEGIDPGSAEGKHNKTYLDSRIRSYKETLFRDGIVEVTLANHSRVVVEKDDFLKSARGQNFAQRLKDKLEKVLSVVGDGYLDLLAKIDLKVVLTGGGASLPMVSNLATGIVDIKGRKIMRNPTPIVPSWIDETYPQFSSQYPQLAVAIGGAAPSLPEQGASFADFKGLSVQTYT
jgi:molecular chaperone HscA